MQKQQRLSFFTTVQPCGERGVNAGVNCCNFFIALYFCSCYNNKDCGLGQDAETTEKYIAALTWRETVCFSVVSDIPALREFNRVSRRWDKEGEKHV